MSTKIIAEGGINHNGDIEIAKKFFILEIFIPESYKSLQSYTTIR